MKVSVVLPYYNRKMHLQKTLESISVSRQRDFEVIVVDDGSDESNRVEPLIDRFRFMRVIRIDPKDKWWINPCIAFNRGFAETKGDIIVFGGSECIHCGDVLSDAFSRINDHNYVVYSCYALSNIITQKIQTAKEPITSSLRKYAFPLGRAKVKNSHGYWYHHPKIRPRPLNFLAAIHKSSLNRIGGFDEEYANGIAYDDDDFLLRVKRARLTINLPDEKRPFAIHQFHESSFEVADKEQRLQRNYELYKKRTSR